ncbi:MAG TPA: SAM-dependent chlorinase/fluorinase, partial [Bacteroidales bacterium]|nr:SAM-dependent chlorinase/fluorinase [Bacteroidales bacterium]
TLTTDWKKDDYYTGAIKGNILSRCNDTIVVTITNQIKQHNVSEAAFIIRNSYNHYPQGSIHIITVGTSNSKDSAFIAASIDDHYFLMPDNGIAGLLGDSEPTEVINLTNSKNAASRSFPAFDIFCPAACAIIKGTSLANLGNAYTEYSKQIPLRATIENSTITGTIIHIDSFGNAITNISEELFSRIGRSRVFNIYVQSKHYTISKIDKYYTDTSPGDLLALFNSIGLLEIGIRNGSAASLLNLNTDSTIRIEFKEQ